MIPPCVREPSHTSQYAEATTRYGGPSLPCWERISSLRDESFTFLPGKIVKFDKNFKLVRIEYFVTGLGMGGVPYSNHVRTPYSYKCYGSKSSWVRGTFLLSLQFLS